MEPTELRVGTTTYRLRRWEYKDGKKWLFKLVTFIANAGSVSGDAETVLHIVTSKLEGQVWEDLCGTVEKYTDVVEGDRVAALSSIAAEHMRGRYVDLALLIKGHLVQEFKDFFDNLGAMLPREEEKKEPEK